MKVKSFYSKNILTLMTGATIAQAIPVVISPILTRIYTPEEFGVLAIFMAITTLFGYIANGRYELAIMLPEEEEDAINIFALGLIITTLLTLVLFALIFFLKDYFIRWLENEEIGAWINLIPLAVFFIGIFNGLNYLNNRNKKYKDIAQATIIKSIVMAIIQISFGVFKMGVSGLMGGQVISQMFAVFRLFQNFYKEKCLIKKFRIAKMLALAKQYKNFPKLSMWAVLANTSSLHLINIFISSFYGIGTLGLYSLIQRTLILPMLLIGNAISQVFYQEASKEKQNGNTILNLYKITMKKMVLMAFPIFFIAFFIIEDLFSFVFGEKWRIAGQYAQIVIPLYFIRFVVSTFTIIPILYNRLDIDLIFQLILLLMSSVIIFTSQTMGITFSIYLFFYTVILFFLYVIYSVFLYKKFVNV